MADFLGIRYRTNRHFRKDVSNVIGHTMYTFYSRKEDERRTSITGFRMHNFYGKIFTPTHKNHFWPIFEQSLQKWLIFREEEGKTYEYK